MLDHSYALPLGRNRKILNGPISQRERPLCIRKRRDLVGVDTATRLDTGSKDTGHLAKPDKNLLSNDVES